MSRQRGARSELDAMIENCPEKKHQEAHSLQEQDRENETSRFRVVNARDRKRDFKKKRHQNKNIPRKGGAIRFHRRIFQEKNTSRKLKQTSASATKWYGFVPLGAPFSL